MALLVAGCITPNQGQLDTLARAAGTAAQMAVRFDTQHRAQYQFVKEGLDVLIAREQWDDASLALALKTMPEVSDPKIALYVEGSLLAYDLVTKVFFKVETAVAVKAFALELRDGIALGLAATTPAPALRAAPSEMTVSVPLIKRPPRPLQNPRII
jgi:hypothetical protein